MYKKIAIIVLCLGICLCGFKKHDEQFKYEYEVILNSNEGKDVIQGYLYKEYLIDYYNELINYLDPSLINDAVINNIDGFANKGSKAEYKNGKIIVYIGEAKGDSIKGSLKTNACDNNTIRVKFFFSKFFTK